MRIDPNLAESPAKAVRESRRPASQLIEAVLALAGPEARLLRHTERAWASVTFYGARHRIVLAFGGAPAVEAGEHFIAALPEHEFTIPRQLVADAVVTSVEHTVLPEPRLVVEAELLLLDEA